MKPAISPETLRVSDEVSPLKKVVIHHPDDGLERITPSTALQFLYDDIVYLPKMREEHQWLTKTISIFTGEENVLEIESMLGEVLANFPDAKSKLLEYVAELEGCPDSVIKKLDSLPVDELVYALITGMIRSTGEEVFAPLPNYLFTRDIGVVINDHLLVCSASKKARTRESILSRCIFYYHPVFQSFSANDKIIDLTKKADYLTIEGGDLIMVDEDHLMIGCSERTTPQAFFHVMEELFEREVIENVIRVDIPKHRSCMHLDTVITQVSHNDFVVYRPFVMEDDKLQVTLFSHLQTRYRTFRNLAEMLRSINGESRFILCGKGIHPHDEREQWTDGCNLFALRSGVAIAYRRNKMTSEALHEAGYKIVDAEDFIEAYENDVIEPDKVENTILTIPSSELSRARGGPHCLTFPIHRG